MKNNDVLKQYKIGLWLGGIKHSIGQIGIYISFVNLFLLSITAYNTGWIQEHFVRLNFIEFIGIVIAVVILAMVLSYKVDMPSYFGFWKQQVGLDTMESQIKSIEANQKLIMRKLGIENADTTDK
jgi:uncharacterized membrane protein YcjF (UPF0283 family)